MKIPAGAAHLPDYIDAPTEVALERQVDASNWLGDLKRRVQHYGYRYDYKARRVTGESYIGSLPLWLLDLADRLVREGIFPKPPDQVIVNEYLPGQGIAPMWIASRALETSLLPEPWLSLCNGIQGHAIRRNPRPYSRTA